MHEDIEQNIIKEILTDHEDGYVVFPLSTEYRALVYEIIQYIMERYTNIVSITMVWRIAHAVANSLLQKERLSKVW